jgi:hypothetical protein
VCPSKLIPREAKISIRREAGKLPGERREMRREDAVGVLKKLMCGSYRWMVGMEDDI